MKQIGDGAFLKMPRPQLVKLVHWYQCAPVFLSEILRGAWCPGYQLHKFQKASRLAGGLFLWRKQAVPAGGLHTAHNIRYTRKKDISLQAEDNHSQKPSAPGQKRQRYIHLQSLLSVPPWQKKRRWSVCRSPVPCSHVFYGAF